MKNKYFEQKNFVKNYIYAITIFIITLVIGISIFFNVVQASVEKNSRETLITNVTQQSEHLNTILNINYSYLNVLAQELSKSEDLFSENNISLIKAFMENTDLNRTAIIDSDGNALYDNNVVKNVAHRRYFKEVISGRRTLSDPLDSSISGSTRVVLGVPVYNSKHKVIGALGGSYDVTALSRMLFEDLFNGQGCSMIIAQNGEIIAFEGDTSYWNLDYRDNFYKYCCKWIIKDKVTVKKIKQDFKEGKENLVTAYSKKEGTRRHYFAYMPMGVNGWILCYALPEQAAQQSYNFIEDYEISFMIVFIVLVTLLILYIVYENHTRNKELLKYAQTDALTGLYNKETTEQLTDELLSEDENKYHAFLILDVDCFKQINDIYGHAVGDIVLQKFGKLLKGTFREGDILGRIGGDEFGVIMKNIQTKDIAMKKAGELLAKTQAYKIDELKGANISISIGISTAPQDGDCYMDLYKRADQALYQAKRSGKARVCNYFS